MFILDDPNNASANEDITRINRKDLSVTGGGKELADKIASLKGTFEAMINVKSDTHPQ